MEAKYPTWGSWQIKTSWYAVGHRSKAHLFVDSHNTICGLSPQPEFGAKVSLNTFRDDQKCKRCLKSMPKKDQEK